MNSRFADFHKNFDGLLVKPCINLEMDFFFKVLFPCYFFVLS